MKTNLSVDGKNHKIVSVLKYFIDFKNKIKALKYIWIKIKYQEPITQNT